MDDLTDIDYFCHSLLGARATTAGTVAMSCSPYDFQYPNCESFRRITWLYLVSPFGYERLKEESSRALLNKTNEFRTNDINIRVPEIIMIFNLFLST